MAKRFLFITYLCLQTFLLCGYVSRPATPVRPLVVRVDIYDSQDGHIHLTDAEQMEAVLGCLRAANTHIPAETQHPTGDRSCTVRVGLSDGSFHIYRQISDCYFSRDSGQWKAIHPKQGARLYSLISTLKTGGFQGAFLFCESPPKIYQKF